jgi:hypothetical protein
VVTNRADLRPFYDDHPGSLTLVSGCLSVREATQLLDDGAQFEAIIILDEDHDLAQRLARLGSDESDRTPTIEHLSLSGNDAASAVSRIHASFTEAMRLPDFFYSAGG